MTRLLLLLLIALLSVPTMAQPGHAAVATPVAARHAMHGGHSVPARPDSCHQADSACLGCIAPSTLPACFIAPPRLYADLPATSAITRGVPLGPDRPATPPPRAA